MPLIPIKYAYLTGSLYFLVIWFVLFLRWGNGNFGLFRFSYFLDDLLA